MFNEFAVAAFINISLVENILLLMVHDNVFCLNGKIHRTNVEFHIQKVLLCKMVAGHFGCSTKVTSKGAIYFPMGKALRSQERLATEEFLKQQGVPTLGYITAPGKMEGGDVLWIDEKTVAIGRGYRTNDEGIRQFKELTKDIIDEYIIVPMPHGDGEEACLHMMSIISFVDTDKAVVYSKYMPVFFREYLIDRGVILIECNDEEYDYLGTNLLALEPGKCILIKGCPDIQKKIEDAGVTVYTYEGKELSYRGTGGPTCLTCPVLRG